jgi:hypothetical protein
MNDSILTDVYKEYNKKIKLLFYTTTTTTIRNTTTLT